MRAAIRWRVSPEIQRHIATRRSGCSIFSNVTRSSSDADPIEVPRHFLRTVFPSAQNATHMQVIELTVSKICHVIRLTAG
jgi:hypothetical protein